MEKQKEKSVVKMIDIYKLKIIILFIITIPLALVFFFMNVLVGALFVALTFWLIGKLEESHEKEMAKTEGRAYEP